ncbi:solute carrier family 43 member 3-like isoform X1 [Patiria miniata]|uniref:Solute carrier family 43 member 3-like n=2 Tax=Patiria miniata TaxID=46514 RepID=A0A913Z985_PATMI|nr:solute carrier family 43 member 3-like isoform X1 [Patiria miniata]
MLTRKVHKVSLLVLGSLECLCFGGWIFGWASLVFVLKQEGYFADKCWTEGTTADPRSTVPSSGSTANASQPTTVPGLAGCADQDAELQLVFTVANFCVSGASLPLGLLFDKMGTLFMRIIISVLMLAGSLMFALSSSNPLLVFPAAVCVSAGGVQLLVVNLQISNLFGRNKWIVMTIFCGCFDSSAWVFLVVKVLYENFGFQVQTSFFILAGSTFVFTLNTFVLLPKKGHIPWPLPPDYYTNQRSGKTLNIHEDETLHAYSNAIKDTEGKHHPKREDDEALEEPDPREAKKVENNEVSEYYNGACGNGLPNGVSGESADQDGNSTLASPSNPLSKDFPSLRACVMSPLFGLFYLWFSILQLDVLFFVSTLNPVLTKLADNDEQLVSSYTNALAFIQLGGILCAPFSGLIVSRNKRRHRCLNKDKEEERLEGRGPYSDQKDAALAYATCTTICLIFGVCGILPILEAQYATFVLSVMSRSFVYSLTASGTSLFFPMEYFGTLYGLLILLSAVFSLLQYPLFIITQRLLNDNDFWVKIGLLSASLLTYSLSIYVFLHARKKEKAWQCGDQTTNHRTGQRTLADNPL